ncbi:Uncharacterized protein HZ326_27672 [Fusarium oxysporum f. sp. albedinis]|nr:Uncharacterized protein HZ326_27672 [Fusarium oxysporum f. sp. albedinis]
MRKSWHNERTISLVRTSESARWAEDFLQWQLFISCCPLCTTCWLNCLQAACQWLNCRIRRFEQNVDAKFALGPCNVAHLEENIAACNHREIKIGIVELN